MAVFSVLAFVLMLGFIIGLLLNIPLIFDSGFTDLLNQGYTWLATLLGSPGAVIFVSLIGIVGAVSIIRFVFSFLSNDIGHRANH